MIEADYSQVISKIAVDENGKRLGKIIRIEELLGKTIKKYKPYAMIRIKKFLQETVVIPIEVEKIKKIEGKYVWFDVLKEDFDEKVKNHRAEIKACERAGELERESRERRFFGTSRPAHTRPKKE